MYYPSNKFLLNSEGEELFFRTKWTTNVNRMFVQKIYDNFQEHDYCPCKLLIAFNICKAKAFKLDANNFVYNIHFSNEFELKNNFFIKSNKEEVCEQNLNFVKTYLPDIYNACVFENRVVSKSGSDTKNYKRPQNKKYKILPKNNIDMEIGTDTHRLLSIANELKNETTARENKDETANLYQEGLKLYKKLEYYNRFKVVLNDEDLYIPKIPNNIQFKTKVKQVRLKMFEKAVEFWGVDKVSMKTIGNKLHVINGQILPPSDNPRSMHNTGSCQHTNGFHSYFIQVRMADEAITRVKICNDCQRKIK